MIKPQKKTYTCRHCGKTAYVLDGIRHTHPAKRQSFQVMSQGADIDSYICSGCGKISVFLTTKRYDGTRGTELPPARGTISEKYIYPIYEYPKRIKNVPAKYMNEYNEAANVKEISAKACALLCRRILELILENECGCTKWGLEDKIKEFAEKTPVSPFVNTSMLYILNAGNATAHGKIGQDDTLIKIKSSDCDSLLDALETVFDYVFTMPKEDAKLAKKVQKVTPKGKKAKN